MLAQQVVTNVGQFAAVIVLAHALGPSGRGAVAFVVSTSLLVGQVLRFGLTSATTYLTAQRPEVAPRLLANGLLTALASSTVASTLSVLVLVAWPSLRPSAVGTAGLVALCLGIVGGDINAVAGALLLGRHRFAAFAVASSMAAWVYAGATFIAFLAFDLEPDSAMLIWGVCGLLGALLLLGCSLYGTGLGRPDAALLRTALRLGARSAAGELAGTTNARADQTIMGAIAPTAELGLYAAAVNAGEVLLYVPNAVGNALLPNLVATEQKDFAHTTLRAFRMVAAITGIAVVAAAAAGWLLIPVVFGARFDGSVAPFLLLLPGALGYGAQRVFSVALTGLGRPGRSSLGLVAGLLTGLALDVLLIPSFGANGAAIAASAAFIAGGMTALLVFRGSVSFDLRALAPGPADVRAVTSAIAARRNRRQGP
jgi:O-antigen/teichoic acid export membrane protein